MNTYITIINYSYVASCRFPLLSNCKLYINYKLQLDLRNPHKNLI